MREGYKPQKEQAVEHTEKDIDLPAEWSRFARDFDLKRGDVEGKTILDIGANDRRFAASAPLNGIDAKILSLDPLYDREKFRNVNIAEVDDRRSRVDNLVSQKLRERLDKNTIAAIAKDIPLSDKSVDLAIARQLPLEENEIEPTVREIFRVLKDNGEFRIFPLASENGRLQKNARMLLRKLGELMREGKLRFELRSGEEIVMRGNRGQPRIREDLLILRKPSEQHSSS